MNVSPKIKSTANTTPSPVHTPASTGEVQELVQAHAKLLPKGAGTKPTLQRHEYGGPVTCLDMTQITGIIEYEPSEYTFTAYAGTRLSEIGSALAAHGQYMPFDPPLMAAGATLGGTIAAGLSGSGRYRYGGLRDFILGVTLVDGQGRLIRGGGKVVKNAAGFDLPKLMVGSLGRLGILISASFKVFPAPPTTATLRATLPDLSDALAALARLMGGPYDLEALDIVPLSDGTAMLLARIGGPDDVLDARLDRLRELVGGGDKVMDDVELWADVREFAWVNPDHLLIKVATTPQTLPALDLALHAANARRHYAVGGNLAWIAWPHAAETCHQLLVQQHARGLLLHGAASRPTIGVSLQGEFLARVRRALDPDDRFIDFE